MADQKYTGEKQPGGQDNIIQNAQIDLSKPDICKFYEGQEVNYTDPNDKAVYTARILKIYNIQNTSTIKYNPFPGAASDDSKHPVITVNNSTLSCIPTVTALQIQDDNLNDTYKGTLVEDTKKDSKLVNATARFVDNGMNSQLASVVPDQNNTELMDYLNRIDGKDNEFDINILRNEANNGYKIQKITANKQDNGKYNMVTLDLDIGPNANDVVREVMKSKISRAIGTVLSNGAIGTENDTTRDLTELYNAENTKAAAVSPEEVDVLLGNIPPITNANAPVAAPVAAPVVAPVVAPQSTEMQPNTSNKPIRSNVFKTAANVAKRASTVVKSLNPLRTPTEENKTKVDLKAMGIGGGKLSRKRKRNMTKSKKRKVRTTRRRR
jgi:hypothetical protein